MDSSPLGNTSIPSHPRHVVTIRGAHPEHESRKDPVAPTRSELLRWRLSYARAGVRTSPADAARKKPVLKGWQDLATTDPRRIHAEGNGASPPFDAILRPTGSRDRVMVLDEDADGEIAKLEEKLGIPLGGTTTEVRTPSGKRHLHLSLPEGVEVDGSVGKHVQDDYTGLDVRGKGNQVLLPPSPGYSFANNLPMAEAPPELIEWARGRKRKAAPSFGEGTRGTGRHEPGDFVPLHSRNAAMVSYLSRKHDGTRNLGGLIAEGLAYRASYFEEPQSFTDEDVIKVARNRFGKEPCRPSRNRDPEEAKLVEGALEECSRYWYAERLPGGGRNLLRNVYRACLKSAAKRSEVGEAVTEDGEVRNGPLFSESTRQLAEVSNMSASSVSRHLNRLVELGALVVIEAPDGLAWTFVLIAPRGTAETTPRNSATPPNQPPPSPKGEKLVRGVAVVRADALTTPLYAWGSIVGNSDAGVLAALEGMGPMTSCELAGRLGISRVRDLVRRRLVKLEEMGLIERNGDMWGLVEDYAAVADAFFYEPYATVRRRRVRTRTDEGRTVTEVEENVVVASDADRVETMKERHRLDRERFANLLKEAAERAEEELRKEDEIRDLLNSWDDERDGLAEAEVDGFVGELEPVEGARDDLGGALEGVEASREAGGAPEVQERPRTVAHSGPTSELSLALGRYLHLNPGRSNETPSWLGIALWAEGYTNGKPPEIGVAAALGELSRRGRWEAA